MFRGRSVLLRVAKAAAVAGSRRTLLSVTSKSIPALTNTIAVRKSFVTSTSRALSTFKTAYDKATAARAAQGIVPKALDAASTSELVALLKNPPAGEEAFLLDLITNKEKEYHVHHMKPFFFNPLSTNTLDVARRDYRS